MALAAYIADAGAVSPLVGLLLVNVALARKRAALYELAANEYNRIAITDADGIGLVGLLGENLKTREHAEGGLVDCRSIQNDSSSNSVNIRQRQGAGGTLANLARLPDNRKSIMERVEPLLSLLESTNKPKRIPWWPSHLLVKNDEMPSPRRKAYR